MLTSVDSGERPNHERTPPVRHMHPPPNPPPAPGLFLCTACPDGIADRIL